VLRLFAREACCHRAIFEHRGRAPTGFRPIARAWPRCQARSCRHSSIVSIGGSGDSRAGIDIAKLHFSARFTRNLDYTRALFSRPMSKAAGKSQPLAAPLRWASASARRKDTHSRHRRGDLDRPPEPHGGGHDARPTRSCPRHPLEGRLQENTAAFFARAGLDFAQDGARDYRGTLAGMTMSKIAFLSAADIVAQLAAGTVHLGVTAKISFAKPSRCGSKGRTFGAARLRPMRMWWSPCPALDRREGTMAEFSRMSRRSFRARRGERDARPPPNMSI